jgi:hypothetical protein
VEGESWKPSVVMLGFFPASSFLAALLPLEAAAESIAALM